MRKRFKWTRDRYYRAKHLARLLSAFEPYKLPDEQPGLARRYCDLMQPIWKQSDPFERPVWLRLEDTKPDGVPF